MAACNTNPYKDNTQQKLGEFENQFLNITKVHNKNQINLNWRNGCIKNYNSKRPTRAGLLDVENSISKFHSCEAVLHPMTWGRCTTRTTGDIKSNLEMDVGKIGAMILAANTGQLILEKCHTTKNCFDSRAGMDVVWLRKHLPQKALLLGKSAGVYFRQQLAGHWCGLSLFYLQYSMKV